jgi:hypothetical protein
MELENLGSLITIKGTNQCLDYLMNFAGHGVFTPVGKVEVSPEHVKAHNDALSKAEIDGLDACEIGQCGSFYWNGNKRTVKTFAGTLVAEISLAHHGSRTVTFTRTGKTFRGFIRKTCDLMTVKRIK